MTLRGGGGGGGGPALSITMTLIFPKIVWTCPLSGDRVVCTKYSSIVYEHDNRASKLKYLSR